MIIQASHMNLGYMQQLQQRKNQGENLGSAEALLNSTPGASLASGLNIDNARTGLVATTETFAQTATSVVGKTEKVAAQPQGELTLGATFANEIIRRLGETQGEDGQPKDSSDLGDSLGQAMDWLRERFGDETAAAAAGMVLQSTSNGVTEESIGDGLLDTIRFIDRNFGFAAGDAVMAELNNGVNTELNKFFDNGLNETFFAVSPDTDTSGVSATQDLTTRIFMRTVQADQSDESETEDLTEKLLNDLKAELDKTAELQDLATRLDEEFNPVKATPQAAAAAYEAMPMNMEPQFADMAV